MQKALEDDSEGAMKGVRYSSNQEGFMKTIHYATLGVAFFAGATTLARTEFRPAPSAPLTEAQRIKEKACWPLLQAKAPPDPKECGTGIESIRP
jgi:hypothetical protein